MRTMLCTLFLLASLTTNAANPFTDASDLWWRSDESGWGMNIAQQGNTLFMTLFVYGSDGKAKWYVASDMEGNPSPPDDLVQFTGKLYETTGPTSPTAFDPSRVVRREVGTATFNFLPPTGGTITYTVDGVTVTKGVSRQTWRVADISGRFNITQVLRTRNCTTDTTTSESLGQMDVSQSGSMVTLTTANGSGKVCTFTGNYEQSGRMGLLQGNFSCSDGTSSSFRMSKIQVTQNAFSAALNTVINGCQRYGHFGGTRADVPDLRD